jgi:hypothetical protein
MKKIIRLNGHLQLEGDESTEELFEALLHMSAHTVNECMRPQYGTPIDALIPDFGVLVIRATPKRNAVNVDISSESL